MILTQPAVLSQPAKLIPIAAKPVKIGGPLPLTGVFSEAAKWFKESYEVWAEEINKKGELFGRPVEMIIYDDESSAEEAVTYCERAITVDKVDLVFGGYPGTANVALMPLVEKYEKVFIGMGGHMKSPPVIRDDIKILNKMDVMYSELVEKIPKGKRNNRHFHLNSSLRYGFFNDIMDRINIYAHEGD